EAGFLIIVGLDDVPDDRGGQHTVLSALEQRDYHDLRVVALREADKPAIVPDRDRLVGFHEFVRRDLRAARLAADLDALQLGAHARAPFVHHAIHAIHDLLDVDRIEL